jgi:hypothetical protein
MTDNKNNNSNTTHNKDHSTKKDDAAVRNKLQAMQQERQRLELEQEQRTQLLHQQRQQAERFRRYAMDYSVQVEFPARVEAKDTPSSTSTTSTSTTASTTSTRSSKSILRTDNDLIQHRLLEAGLLYEVPVTAADTLAATSAFCADLERTGCFNGVTVQLGGTSSESDAARAARARAAADGSSELSSSNNNTAGVTVTLDEKKWYRLHAGGGVKTDGWLGGGAAKAGAAELKGSGFLPVAEFDASVGLRNVTGHLDTTDLQYTLDTQSIASWSLRHARPLYSVLPAPFNELVLANAGKGSQYAVTAAAVLDTVDYEWTRSYKEFQKLLSVTVGNSHSVASAEQAPGVYQSLNWSVLARDVVPRRHGHTPFQLAASPEIVSQAGPSVKHSVTAEFRTNDEFANHVSCPTAGLEWHGKAEVATPPGDVGFAKAEGGVSVHVPVLRNVFHDLSLHGSLAGGLLQSLTFGGLCRPAAISDRFFCGGPVHLRGFMPAGIGPRAATATGGGAGGASSSSLQSSPAGDALGGDFFYTATAMASVVPSPLAPYLDPYGIRFLGFMNAGTCIGNVRATPVTSILASSRVSVGVGVVSSAMGPRIEATYAWPLRYGPRDARRQFQFGMGFSFG